MLKTIPCPYFPPPAVVPNNLPLRASSAPDGPSPSLPPKTKIVANLARPAAVRCSKDAPLCGSACDAPGREHAARIAASAQHAAMRPVIAALANYGLGDGLGGGPSSAEIPFTSLTVCLTAVSRSLCFFVAIAAAIFGKATLA